MVQIKEMVEWKTCKKCGKLKDENAFRKYKKPSGKVYLANKCTKCQYGEKVPAPRKRKARFEMTNDQIEKSIKQKERDIMNALTPDLHPYLYA